MVRKFSPGRRVSLFLGREPSCRYAGLEEDVKNFFTGDRKFLFLNF